jgi:hypothetical protein
MGAAAVESRFEGGPLPTADDAVAACRGRIVRA